MDFARELHAVQVLKAKYARYMDTKHWHAFRELFTEDLEYYVHVYGEPAPTTPTFHGPDEIVGWLSKSDPRKVTVHHLHSPEIEFLDEDTATGIWAMFSWADDPALDFAVQCYGHYHDRYVRGAEGGWRIASTRLTRLRQHRVDHLAPESVNVIDRAAMTPASPATWASPVRSEEPAS